MHPQSLVILPILPRFSPLLLPPLIIDQKAPVIEHECSVDATVLPLLLIFLASAHTCKNSGKVAVPVPVNFGAHLIEFRERSLKKPRVSCFKGRRSHKKVLSLIA